MLSITRFTLNTMQQSLQHDGPNLLGTKRIFWLKHNRYIHPNISLIYNRTTGVEIRHLRSKFSIKKPGFHSPIKKQFSILRLTTLKKIFPCWMLISTLQKWKTTPYCCPCKLAHSLILQVCWYRLKPSKTFSNPIWLLALPFWTPLLRKSLHGISKRFPLLM